MNYILDFGKEVDKNSNNLLNDLPSDQYVCPKCKKVPEIIGIDYEKDYSINLKCEEHGNMIKPLKEYFEEESKYIYTNEICEKDNKYYQKNFKNYIFDYCKGCQIILCGACYKEHLHKSSSIKINEFNNICKEHAKNYIQFCKTCNKHLCKECEDEHNYLKEFEEHDISNLEISVDKNLNFLLEEREKLIKKRNLIDYLIKFIETLLITYDRHRSNYFHRININNFAKSVNDNINKDKYMKEMLLTNLDNLERTALHFLNLKLKVQLTGNETIIDLSNKNVGNTEFHLISEIRFKNAKELLLSKNQISDISNLEKLKSPNLQVLDLSFNNINNIKSFKKLSQTKQKIMKIYLNNNNIYNADVFKEKIFKDLVDINLDQNHILQKDIQEIKDIIEGKKIPLQPSISYTIKKEKPKKYVNFDIPKVNLPLIKNNNIKKDKDNFPNTFYIVKKKIEKIISH